jgi:hypothetical protein
MRKYLQAIYDLDITVIQLNAWNPQTGQLECRRVDMRDED